MFECKECDEDLREERNCGNRKKLLHTLLIGNEWERVPEKYHEHEARKIEDLKFFACPLTTITGNTWELLRQVNTCCNNKGEIVHLPEPDLSILDQSPRFLRAVEIIRGERNSSWFQERQQKWAKQKAA